MTAFLGIDGGGTKTDFILIDPSGRVLGAHRSGSAYYLEIGLDGLERLLAKGIRALLEASALTASDITFAFLGLPAYGENAALTDRLDRAVETCLPRERYRCGNDVVCGWAGALAGHDGIAVIAGTGSIAYGERAGAAVRAGGWGELFGDEGSGFWIAREALSAFSRMADGRLPREPLYELMRDHFGTTVDLEICARVYGPPALGRSDLAALAPLAARAAHAGDSAARTIVERAATELTTLVHAVHDGLGFGADTVASVSHAGSLFTADDLVLPSFRRQLQTTHRRYALSPPRTTPVAGAALHAATLAGFPLDDAAIAAITATPTAAEARR